MFVNCSPGQNIWVHKILSRYAENCVSEVDPRLEKKKRKFLVSQALRSSTSGNERHWLAGNRIAIDTHDISVMKPTFEAPDFAYETALAFNFIASYAAPKFAVKFRINLNHTGAGQSLALLLHVLSRCYPHQLIVIGYKRVCKIMTI